MRDLGHRVQRVAVAAREELDSIRSLPVLVGETFGEQLWQEFEAEVAAWRRG